VTCDFCNEEHEGLWFFPTREFIVLRVPPPKDGAQGVRFEAGAWAACHECYPLVREHKLKELLVRARPEDEKAAHTMGITQLGAVGSILQTPEPIFSRVALLPSKDGPSRWVEKPPELVN
jgi:hypothetical protein